MANSVCRTDIYFLNNFPEEGQLKWLKCSIEINFNLRRILEKNNNF